ncbi:MAG TPA: DUF2269 family protein [Actinomycetota bacterium]
MPTSWSWFTFWLLVHLLAVAVALGPTFVFPLIIRLSERRPRHAVFGKELDVLIQTRLVLPALLVAGLSGIGLIVTANVDPAGSEWLLISLGLYAVLLAFSVAIQLPATRRAVVLLRDAAGGDPSPKLAAVNRQLRRAGGVLSILFLSILVLMIWRPGAAVG